MEAHTPGDASVEPTAVGAVGGPGARLKAAREAAGLSLDQVAQQLKLAQRQVKALEDENFAELPGRTFSRGFLRNYARLVNLDPDDLLQHLPDAAMTPSLGAPALHPTGAMIAELPSAGAGKRANFGRWLIPLALVACIVGAATYEWYHGGLATLGDAARTIAQANAPDAKSDGSATTALPNPLAREAVPAASAVTASTVTPSPVMPNPVMPSPVTASPATAGVDRTAQAATAVAQVAPVTPAEPVIDAPILLSYSGPSWTEVRDRSGQLLISRLVAANSVEPVRGTPPFDIVLGNAPAVTLTYRGNPVDLAPHTRQNVARLSLQ